MQEKLADQRIIGKLLVANPNDVRQAFADLGWIFNTEHLDANKRRILFELINRPRNFLNAKWEFNQYDKHHPYYRIFLPFYYGIDDKERLAEQEQFIKRSRSQFRKLKADKIKLAKATNSTFILDPTCTPDQFCLKCKAEGHVWFKMNYAYTYWLENNLDILNNAFLLNTKVKTVAQTMADMSISYAYYTKTRQKSST